MPYTYVSNPQLCEVAYTIRKINNFDLGREHWTDPENIEYGRPSDLGGSEDEIEEKCEVIKADEDEDVAGAEDDGNFQEGRSFSSSYSTEWICIKLCFLEPQGEEEQNDEE